MPAIHQVVGLGAESGCLERVEALLQARPRRSGAHVDSHPARGGAHLHEPAGGCGNSRLDRLVLETVGRAAGRAALRTQTIKPQRLEVSYLGLDVRLHRQAARRRRKDDPGVEAAVTARGIARVRGELDELVVVPGDVAAAEDEPGPGRHTAHDRTKPAEALRENPPRQTKGLQTADPAPRRPTRRMASARSASLHAAAAGSPGGSSGARRSGPPRRRWWSGLGRRPVPRRPRPAGH